MRQLLAFSEKEWMEGKRTGKLTILLILFILFGIMNPAIAKLTPRMFRMLSDSFKDAGAVLADIEVTALTSWTQFYKNIPMALIIFLIMFGGILTVEYQKGTLVHILTRGLLRWKVIIAKLCYMAAVWTAGYWICFGITYGYNAYFWDNSIAPHILFAAACYYLFGLWLCTVIMAASALMQTNSAVLVTTGCVFAGAYLLGMIPKVREYLPTQLMNSGNLLNGVGTPEDYLAAIGITLALSVLGVIAAIAAFNKKSL